jgi:hypothetical protein
MPPILSRMRSPTTSRSNCAKDNKTFRVRRPIEVVVLHCCVTETKDAPLASRIYDLGKIGERAGQPVDLGDDQCRPVPRRYRRAAAAAPADRRHTDQDTRARLLTPKSAFSGFRVR